MAPVNPLIESSHAMATANTHGKCFPIIYPIGLKIKEQFRFTSKKILKDTRDRELINCRKRAAVVVGQLCAIGW